MAVYPKKRVFLSFIDEDKARIWGLRLLAANPNYDLDFYDESLRTPIDSLNAAYIMAKIRAKIERTSVTVCLISEQTYSSRWVDWELEETDRQRKAIIAMALKGVTEAILPTLVKAKGLMFHGWDPGQLNALIREA